jgi:hypothetical protein
MLGAAQRSDSQRVQKERDFYTHDDHHDH